jgi:hypothetical protein
MGSRDRSKSLDLGDKTKWKTCAKPIKPSLINADLGLPAFWSNQSWPLFKLGPTDLMVIWPLLADLGTIKRAGVPFLRSPLNRYRLKQQAPGALGNRTIT